MSEVQREIIYGDLRENSSSVENLFRRFEPRLISAAGTARCTALTWSLFLNIIHWNIFSFQIITYDIREGGNKKGQV